MDQKYELNARFQLDQIRPLEVTTQVYSFSKEAMRKEQVFLNLKEGRKQVCRILNVSKKTEERISS